MRPSLLLPLCTLCACATPNGGAAAPASTASAPAAATSGPPHAEPPVSAALAARARSVLEQSLEDKSGSRLEALSGLGLIGPKDALERLTKALQSENGETRFAAARGMRTLASPEAAPALIAAWKKEKGWAVKKELALAAGSNGVQQLVPELKLALVSGQPELQAAAAWALQDLGDPAGAQALEQQGKPPRPDSPKEGTERWSRKVLRAEKQGDVELAARTLAQRGGPEDVPLFEPLLGSQNATLRTWAALALLRLARP